MARQSRSKRTKVRGNLLKAQSPAALAAIVLETVRLCQQRLSRLAVSRCLNHRFYGHQFEMLGTDALHSRRLGLMW
jgi:hypothetical protein